MFGAAPTIVTYSYQAAIGTSCGRRRCPSLAPEAGPRGGANWPAGDSRGTHAGAGNELGTPVLIVHRGRVHGGGGCWPARVGICDVPHWNLQGPLACAVLPLSRLFMGLHPPKMPLVMVALCKARPRRWYELRRCLAVSSPGTVEVQQPLPVVFLFFSFF
ncbi:hypothetical protein BGZ61DRAFT_237319 [Ilyonectria robusta]|uniref:uncharacterized protein n=1 Tax=Ilyonectria robusta TaxID=1079257 RepID=UPI001E8EBBAC|nr:uncharacterized protein BGZ61DRAFT_237319 [Ilyonectria robusta]KAH8699796.1 hypothetical protein BGZ61DRAFT_237319 [Ilyonectria robusta]